MTPAAGGGLSPELDIIIHTIRTLAAVTAPGVFSCLPHNFLRCAIYGQRNELFHGIVLVLLLKRAASGRCGPFCVHKHPGHIITPPPRSRPKYGVSRTIAGALNYTRAPSAIYG